MKNQRRDFFIKKRLQAQVILVYLLLLLSGGLGLAYVLYRNLRRDLHLAMFRGHFAQKTTWGPLLPDVLRINTTVTIILIVLSLAATLAITLFVSRAARVVRRNIRSTTAGSDIKSWARAPRPQEFRHLQKLLALGLQTHRERIATLRQDCSELRTAVGEVRERLSREGAAPDPVRLASLQNRTRRIQESLRSLKLPQS